MTEPTAVELADAILRTYEAVIATGEAVQRHAEETEAEVARLWQSIAELRDDSHEGLAALSNRLQNLTTAVTTDPAEVAERIADRGAGFTCTQVGCYIRHPHEHKPEGVLYR